MLQFAPNMRYEDKVITYRINDCPRYKWMDIEKAFNKISGLTPVFFNPVIRDEQLVVNCSPALKKAKKGDDYGVVEMGRGGPRYTLGEHYNIIVGGEVLIERDHDCSEPLVEIHEILHAMGYKHSSDPSSILYPMLDCSQTIKREILDDITRLYNISGLPDLVIKSVTLKKVSKDYVIRVEAVNSGMTESAPAKIIIKNTDTGETVADFAFGSLEPGAGFAHTVKANYEIKTVEVELKTGFEEMDKANNKAKARLER
ncbi:MAG: M10 family metallopeptidase domain-containing protein [Deltaproteobacteria bacterium]|nr:M10 family metallopeptidase domain-containing protein [Deltaproteobacteria bacterium]